MDIEDDTKKGGKTRFPKNAFWRRKKGGKRVSQKMYIDGQDEKMLEDVCGHPINFIVDSSASYTSDDDGNNDNGDDIDYDND